MELVYSYCTNAKPCKVALVSVECKLGLLVPVCIAFVSTVTDGSDLQDGSLASDVNAHDSFPHARDVKIIGPN
jgi:hypothetical protein